MQKQTEMEGEKKACVLCYVSNVTSHVSHAMRRVSHVACHLAPVTNINRHSHGSSPW